MCYNTTVGLGITMRRREFILALGGAVAWPLAVQAGGLIIVSDVFFTIQSRHLAALAISHAMPAIFQDRQFVAAGGLMSYEGGIPDSYRQGGVYTGRILKGEKPANLPVVQARKLELTINLKNARALGLNMPHSLIE